MQHFSEYVALPGGRKTCPLQDATKVRLKRLEAGSITGKERRSLPPAETGVPAPNKLMEYVEAAKCAADFETYLSRAVKYNEVIGIAGAEGNAVLLSEEEYDALMETLFIMRSEETRLDIAQAAAESLEEAIAEEDVDWD